jgi:hypothetical protein
MATTTPNYAWVVPTSSDLVKNGATAIETLGDSVDASLWNSGYGQAGKNKIINGNFGINQRAFTSNTTAGTYNFDRFLQGGSDGTITVTPQTFTLGTAPVAGYESTNFLQIVTAGQTLTTAAANIQQRIESVKTFAGQTATFSFWAKANTGTPNVNVSLSQVFGTGGSPSTAVATLGTVQAISTSWARYSFTIAVPSISGKTLGTAKDDYLAAIVYVSGGSASAAPTVGVQNNTFQLWGWQVEVGSIATPFQTASGGSPQAELAMCQRYYQRMTGTVNNNFGVGTRITTTGNYVPYYLPVQMRTSPTFGVGNQTYFNVNNGITNTASTAVALDQSSPYIASVNYTAGISTTGTAGNIYVNTTGAYLEFIAEL